MRTTFCVLSIVAGAAIVPAAAAEAVSRGQRLAATCVACHGAEGTAAGNALPSLAGQSKEALTTSLKAFKAGTRPATVMHQIAKGYTDEQIELLAAFYASRK